MIGAHHSVLEKHGSPLDRAIAKSFVSPTKRDAMELEDVAVIGDYMMNFHRVSSIDNNFRLCGSK